MEIFVCLDVNQAQVRFLRQIAGNDVIHIAGDCSKVVRPPPEFISCQIALGNPPFPWLKSADKLRWIQLESTGFNEYAPLADLANEPNPILTNLAGFFAEPVAETCLAGILALYRGMHKVVSLKETRTWRGDRLRSCIRTLAGARVVLFGYGAINRRLHELLQPFGCEVAVFRRDWKPVSLDRELGRADIVVCACPETPDTRRAFDRRRLGELMSGALFVNVGRGSLVDEEALADALVQGTIGGALLDVTEREPLPKCSRLWDCNNVILSQHSGGGSVDEIDRKLQVFANNLQRYRQGKALVGQVDFRKGY